MLICPMAACKTFMRSRRREKPMSKPDEQASAGIDHLDPVWSQVRAEAEKRAAAEPSLSGFLHTTVLNQAKLEDVVAGHLAEKMGNSELAPSVLRAVFEEAYSADASIGTAMRADIVAT
ncbi:MAG: hypothetical protein EBT71_05940 [Alphaproteobacteria bacterium]|nr:hypothetical protein [Alphaproteobacteria bacterium]